METSYIIPVQLKDVNKTDWKFTGIYKITNVVNGKSYIGQALDIRKRLMEHANNNHDNKVAIYKAIDKYGIDNFEARILAIINTFGKNSDEIKKELNYHECFYIDLYDTYNNGYNMTLGGDSTRLGYKHTKETIEKIKAAHKGKTPKAAIDAQRKTYCYDIANDCVIEAKSIKDASRKSGVDYRSIDHICCNDNYKNGGRFIAGKRWLFSFNKEDLGERVNYYVSGEYAKDRLYRYTHHWVLWRERHGRFQQKDS